MDIRINGDFEVTVLNRFAREIEQKHQGQVTAKAGTGLLQESISFERMLEGLISFREEYRGEYWLEVFLLAGHTAIDSEIGRIADCVRHIKPDRVQLNTATRPAAEEYADLAARFDPPAEVIADYRGVHAQSDFKAGQNSVLEMIRRRPCSLEDVADGLGMHRNEAIKYVEELDAEGLLETRSSGGKLFYSGKHQPKEAKS